MYKTAEKMLEQSRVGLKKYKAEVKRLRKSQQTWKDQAISSTKNKLHYQARAINAEDEVKRLKAILGVNAIPY